MTNNGHGDLIALLIWIFVEETSEKIEDNTIELYDEIYSNK
jgi:hypothetical protein